MADGDNALSSLWGRGAADAVRTRECVAMPGKREQDILSPPEILDPLAKLWGAPYPTFDPFGSYQHTIAYHTARLPDDGQRYVWPDLTYGNPPYAMLARALVGSAASYPDAWDEGGKVTHRTKLGAAPYYFGHEDGRTKRWCFLIPVRSHRKWWRAITNRDYVEVFELDPLTFVGYPQSFPAPLCLLFTCVERGAIAAAFKGLGDLRV